MTKDHLTSLTVQYFLNHRLDLREIEWQMREIADKGYQGIYPHARQGLLTPFLSEDWWRAMEKILDICRQTNTEMWIWDEDYYPSGTAGGRIVWENPGLRARSLNFTVKAVEGAGPFEADFDEGMLLRAFALPKLSEDMYGPAVDITAFCGTRRQQWSERRVQQTAYSPQINPVGPPHWRCTMHTNRFAVAWTPPTPGRYVIIGITVATHQGVHTDMLNPQSVQRFIELCYEPYFQRFGNEFGKRIKGAFTDEPSPGHILFPWTDRFSQHFKEDHGYDVLEHLPHLALNIDDRSPMVRHHYRLTQHRLQRENYTTQVARWCEAHGILAAGHLTRTEWLSLDAYYWPNELRCYQPMHIPCADPLTAASAWTDAAAYHTALKVASSAAHLFGRRQAGSDALAVIGDEASLRDLKFILDYQMVLGINYFVIHGLGYSLDGPRKDEVPPSLFYQHTEWKHMRTLLDHVRATCETLTDGEHVCDLAVLYPSTSLGAQIAASTPNPSSLPDEKPIHEVVETLLCDQKDFDFIDEITLQESVDSGGRVTTPERYRTIILPHLRFIDAYTAEALLRFARAGGKVIAIGQMPRALTHDLSSPIEKWADDKIVFSQLLDITILDTLAGPEVRGPGARDVFVLCRRKDNIQHRFVFNRREQAFRGTLDGKAITVPPRGSLMLTDSKVPAQAEARLVAELTDGWRVRFEPNQLPLNFWHATQTMGPWDDCGQFCAPAFNLLAREKDPLPPGNGAVRYVCRFMLTGEVPDARLVMEDSTIGGEWKLFVNGMEIRDWSRSIVFDCRNLQANVGHALRGGSTPTLNIITIEAQGPNRGLREVPYLYGSFACEFRYSHPSFPFVRGEQGELSLDTLQPWVLLGRPTFSGSAVYSRRFETQEAGDYVLDLGNVIDVAAVTIDDAPVATLAWPPYRCPIPNLRQGVHELCVEVTNPPANRNRAAHLPAGLLGPVRLLR